MRRALGVTGLLAPVVLLGCATAPIPKVAVEGTTVTVPMPADFEVGYGSAIFGSGNAPSPAQIAAGSITGPPLDSGNLAREDLQRGEVVALLVDPTGTAVATLPVRYVTRLGADPGSELGRTADGFPGQKVMFVDIPVADQFGAPLVTDAEGQKMFGIQVRRFRRSSTVQGSTTFTAVPQSYFLSSHSSDWVGWGNDFLSDPMAPIPITIRDAAAPDGLEPQPQTPFDGWGAYDFGWTWGVGRMTGLNAGLAVPDPEFRVALTDPGSGTPLSAPFPGAWELTLTYPPDRMRITGVRMVRPAQNGALVAHESSAEAACGSSPPPGELRIRVVDPEAAASGLLVSYQLNEDIVGCAARVTHSDLAVAGTLGYDLDGVGVEIGAAILEADFN